MSSILDVAVMSPNRYFCLGLSSLQEQKSLTAIRLHFCHDLKSLKTLMESIALSGVLMETFGEGENIYDAFVFGDYLKGRPETSPCLFFAHSGAAFPICRTMRAIMFPQLKMKYGNILH